MLGVVDDFVDVLLQEPNGVEDEVEFFLERTAEGVFRVKAPALAEDAGDGRFAREEGFEQRVLGGRNPRLAGRAERGVARLRQFLLASALEKRGVARVRARPPALDVGDAELVQGARDAQLVFDRKADVLALRAVAQRSVVDADAFVFQGASGAALAQQFRDETGMDVVAHKSRNAEGEPESRENHGPEDKPAPLVSRLDAEKANPEQEAGLSHVELIVAEVEADVVFLQMCGGL